MMLDERRSRGWEVWWVVGGVYGVEDEERKGGLGGGMVGMGGWMDG